MSTQGGHCIGGKRNTVQVRDYKVCEDVGEVLHSTVRGARALGEKLTLAARVAGGVSLSRRGFLCNAPAKLQYTFLWVQDIRYAHFSIFALADGHNGCAAPTYFAAQAVQRIASLLLEKHGALSPPQSGM
jgi:hypothetical protein